MPTEIDFSYDIDPFAPKQIARALAKRLSSPEDLYSTELQNISSDTNQAIFYLAARGYPTALIAEKLALDAVYVHAFCQSSTNKAYISKLASELPEDDPEDTHANEEIFFRELAEFGRNRLVSLIASDNDYVALSTLKEANNRAYGKPKESIKVTHEHSLAGMLSELDARRPQLEAPIIDI
jgi:hypothetical protein